MSVPEITGLEKLREEFRVDIQQARSRVSQLKSIIPQLEKEKEQLLGMIAVMEKVLTRNEEQKDGTHESEDDGNESNSTEK